MAGLEAEKPGVQGVSLFVLGGLVNMERSSGLQVPRTTMQRIVAALATRSIGLVDAAPGGIAVFCKISRAAASVKALALRRNSCSSCRMRFLSTLDSAFSACCKVRADCWPRIQAWRHCWICLG